MHACIGENYALNCSVITITSMVLATGQWPVKEIGQARTAEKCTCGVSARARCR